MSDFEIVLMATVGMIAVLAVGVVTTAIIDSISNHKENIK